MINNLRFISAFLPKAAPIVTTGGGNLTVNYGNSPTKLGPTLRSAGLVNSNLILRSKVCSQVYKGHVAVLRSTQKMAKTLPLELLGRGAAKLHW